MAELGEVKRRHKCMKCRKQLYRKSEISGILSKRVHFEGHNYCIVCGYFKIQERIDWLERFSHELYDKYPKEITVHRLTGR